jgi:hypothetical protein
LRDSTFALFLEKTKPLEGVCTWMYPDTLGLVTTGIGNLADPVELALALPWIHKGSGLVASSAEIRAAWTAVKQCGLGKLGGGAARIQMLTELRLLESDVDALVRAKCQANETALAAHFANWDALPDRAQAATLMLAWACGYAAITEPHGGLHRFPRFEAALQAGQLAVTQDDERGRPVLVGGCAFECVMPASANPGNDLTARNAATQALFVAAALEVAGKL